MLWRCGKHDVELDDLIKNRSSLTLAFLQEDFSNY